MRAVIILGHGSRVPEAGKNMEIVASLLKEKYDLEMVESCQMSRLGPHYPEILAKCVEGGAHRSDGDSVLFEQRIAYPPGYS